MHTKRVRVQLLGTDTSFDDKKYKISAEIEHCLDKLSTMILKSEYKGNGPEAWKRLVAHFSTSNTPCVMDLLEQVTSLLLEPTAEKTDDLIRAETLAFSLEVAVEKISEMFLVSVVS